MLGSQAIPNSAWLSGWFQSDNLLLAWEICAILRSGHAVPYLEVLGDNTLWGTEIKALNLPGTWSNLVISL